MNEKQVKEFVEGVVVRARQFLVAEHGFTEEEGILLSPSTVALVEEIEEANRQHLIDQALVNGDKQAFIQLTGGEGK